MKRILKEPGFENMYEIDDKGNVYSLEREVTYYSTRWNTDVIMKMPYKKMKIDTSEGKRKIMLVNKPLRKTFYVDRLLYAYKNGMTYEQLPKDKNMRSLGKK